MRKIKPDKKAARKKQEKIHKLMDELFYHHLHTHDEEKLFAVVKEMYELRSEDPVPAEKVASIYIDYHKVIEADLAVRYLEEKFPPDPYRLFLRSRVQDLKQDYGGCIFFAEKALSMKRVDLLTKMMIYNILGHAYRYVGDAVNSLKYYELSAKEDPTAMTDSNLRIYVDRIKREDFSNYLFSLHNINVDRDYIYQEILKFNDLYDRVEWFEHDRDIHAKHNKIRIGYVSPDIRKHVVVFFSYAFFKHYDKDKFEVFVYAKNREDHITQKIKEYVDGFRNILYMTPGDAAKLIQQDEIDILVDLAGHTADNVLPVIAYKPAPVIISGIGWFNTTGFRPVDYFLVDQYTDPPGLNEEYFSEKMLRLKHSHFCYEWHGEIIEPSLPPCIEKGYITFVSFNNLVKVTDETLRIWVNIVMSVPGAKLYLKGKAFRDEYGVNYILRRIAAAGLPLDRLIYEPDEENYLIKYRMADIALDTFPYPGGGTTCDALYMGVPVITLVQERHNSRFGYSLLKNIGIEELCATTIKEYEEKAVALANDIEKLKEYHTTIRNKMISSPVMDSSSYMREIETAYEKIFKAWINEQDLPDISA